MYSYTLLLFGTPALDGPAHNFDRSSSCSFAISSFGGELVGQPMTSPSASLSEGLGMTWKWT